VDFEDEAFVLAARAHGETGAIVELLTQMHGRFVAHVAGGASRRMKPVLQPGARVIARYRSRVDDQLGSAQLEAMGEGPAAFFDQPLALAALASAAAVAAGALPEREAHSGAFQAFEAFAAVLPEPDIWPVVYVRFEAGLLQELGFALDLSRCAATGTTDDLVYVSPKSGRAVSRSAGAPYAERLLRLPPFMLSAQGGVGPGDIADGMALTGHFLEAFVFAAMNRPLPPARMWLLDRLSEAGRL
jgi:DNA repair protein RecO (recombination protein O)